ncbi:MAG: c-type cytochrome [Gammaproteobacteria bacterium]|nr:c-type cytochrome [Gammaproteobacteria bacterium]
MKKIQIAVIIGTLTAMSTGMQVQAGGADTYNSKCMACHASGAAGAPKLGDNAAWAPRIATGMDALVASVTNGKGAMPPKGACADCSADDLTAAVEYMVSGSQ